MSTQQAILVSPRHDHHGKKYMFVKAYAGNKRFTWDYQKSEEQNVMEAGLEFARLYDWDQINNYVLGTLNYDFVLVAIPKDKK